MVIVIPLPLAGFTVILRMTEAVVRRCFFQNRGSQKMAFKPATLLKRDSDTGFFL